MNRGFSTFEDLGSDVDLIEDYDECQSVSKKDWFRPANASLARLDKVKPVATVYNIGLRDARDLKGSRGKTTPVVTNDQLSDLQTEPPLSTVSYQKAAWGSESSIPEVLKQAAQVGTRPSRPSSAKSGTGTKPLLTRKSRPQSAKDPLCPNGKKAAAPLRVKGQKFDPTERAGKDVLPPGGAPVGWAGPPAGLCDPSLDSTINYVQSANAELQKPQGPPPPAPNASPEPQEDKDSFIDIQPDSPPPSPGLCLSLSLPSADADASEEPDTGRLLEEANKYVKTQKKKESQKIRFFKADSHGPSGISDALKTSVSEPQGKSPQVPNSSEPGSQRKASLSSTPLQPQMKRIKEEVEEDGNNNCTPDRSVVSHEDRDRGGGDGSGVISCCERELSLRIALNSEPEEDKKATPLPPSKEFDLEYLGPASGKDQRSRSHPIFLMPDDKLSSQKQTGKPTHSHRPQSAKDRGAGDKDSIENKPPRAPKDKETLRATAPADEGHDKGGTKNMPALRSGVHICEDRNITVDITPRNLGRKVTGKSSRKHRAELDFSGLEVHNALSAYGKAGSSGDAPKLEVMTDSVKSRTLSPPGTRPFTPAANISVVYDDDSDREQPSDKKKKRKRYGPMKEKDLVTMVSNISLSDEEDGDDPSREVDIEMGEERKGSGHTELGSSSSALSKGERNYYDIARRQAKAAKGAHASLEEKENFITMTTKTILFDLEKPTESVVKTILDAPLPKAKDRVTPVTAQERCVGSRPKTAGRPPSAKLSKSDFRNITPVAAPLPTRPDCDHGDDGGFTCSSSLQMPSDEERPGSRRGFVSMQSNNGEGDTGDRTWCTDMKEAQPDPGSSQRPPSGKRRPLSASSKILNRPPAAPSRQSRQRAKESVIMKQRPQSASPATGHSLSATDVQRANAAAQALRAERDAAVKTPAARVTARFTDAGRHHTSCNRSGKFGRRDRIRSASLSRKPLLINSKDPNAEVSDTEEMEECREIQNRLACYGIDVKPETLERALFPPTGKTLYYDLPDSQLPKSYSNGLLSHPRFWLPMEHRRLKLAEKKLALAELSLWRQKKEEERKARLAAGKEKVGKKGKKKGKKKLQRSQSIC